jgi:putative hemolysin
MGNRRLYTATEFDLSGFAAQIPRALEIGRLCIHPDYRESNAILVLWSGMLAYYGRAEFTYLMGCSSIRTDKLSVVNAVHSYFHDKKYSIDRFRIRPLPHLKIPQLRYVHGVDEKAAFSVLPATIKGYLRLGSEAVSEPIYDPIFRTYDFCMILSKSQVSSRYRRHFLAKAEREAEPASCISGSAA